MSENRSRKPRHHSAPATSELLALTEGLSLVDQRRFTHRIRKASSLKARSAIARDLHTARARMAEKIAALPEITYPETLPVSARRDDIAEAIENNQVVIIAGETGSGKTTQIPKICLELGRGRTGLIGHTQPRRLAARTVAERIADELGQSIGQSVGYAIRFDDRVGPTTAIKLMTDGILLAEMSRDRYFNAYDTLIIDEAHERSLNIDFILGYLKRILPKRPDLKVIITSATIDPERFSRHFADAANKPAPIIEVSGRTYPVEVRYRPLVGEDAQGRQIDVDPLDGLVDACRELMNEGPGDILCFFAGEADIRDAMEAIEGQHWRGVEVTPLFGRLSNQDQHRVFTPHSGRRIVLATNIAETSLTVPGIHYVIDTGTARISRYSTKNKVQRLPIEPISQASANQRSGRCGRIADGVAIRLYSEEDFISRPEFTDPEILRTNLASVILQMANLRLGDIADFPFVQPPETKLIRDGLLLLRELGALSDGEKNGNPVLTPVGKQLARIPLDPRMARMMIQAHDTGCLAEVIVIVAALTIQDVRERPMDFKAQADQQHARFKHGSSDFIGYLKLWDYITGTRNQLSGNKFRKRMKQEFLHYMRIREWFDLVRQLKNVADQLDWNVPGSVASEPDEDSIHQALLAGLLSHIGMRIAETKEFQGARNMKFWIFPGSNLSKKPPQFVMAAEIVETSRLFARDVARINPIWVEKLAPHLLRHNYSEPHWSTKRVAAMVHQKSTLYGVTIVADRTVPYHRVDPVAARDMFIRHALIAGEWTTHHEFFHSNREKLDTAAGLEDKARRRNIVVDEDTLFDFYDRKIPADVTTGILFDKWWKNTRDSHPQLLDFDPAKLISDEAETVSEDAFPDLWRQGSIDYELSYHFEPGAPDDGVTVKVPVPLLGNLSSQGFDWLVPGLRLEMLTALIKTLPKPLRRSVVPAPDFAQRCLPQLTPYTGTVTAQLADALRVLGGSGINPDDFDPGKLPDHLRITFAAVDKRGKVIDRDKNLDQLKKRRAGQITSSLSKAGRVAVKKEAKTWDDTTLGEIRETVTTTVDGQQVNAYPALVATSDGIAVTVMPTKQEAEASMLTATLTLLMRQITVNTQGMLKGLPLKQRVAVESFPHGGAQGLIDDARTAAIRDSMMANGGPVRKPDEFTALKKAVAPDVPGRIRRIVVILAPAMVTYHQVKAELDKWQGPAIDDMKRQLDFLLPEHALARHGIDRLKHLDRYLRAMLIRLETMGTNPDRDADNQDTVEDALDYLQKKLAALPSARQRSPEVKDIQWMIQELRVSLFAQQLGTARPASLRRVQKAVDKLR
ncbi:ATP-dependent RNA helicase HrpA [Corynebacterium mendelii]|uniref:ATP-dependent RNA helicase HrpA n=1 Tax=Corynebacterium mendelii TaxID=2765362 RepID=A0A939IWS1_9CORY|nr:ATP-dependent RNA helicase HrpA [Corynebacterium mendelii]MBN9643328.1 ATP-dependent RNA helicase HrpA [Corynebacterium mendelii]